MCPMKSTLALLALLIGAVIAREPQTKQAASPNQLWAAISVTETVRDLDTITTDPFMMVFGLVNDTDKTVKPEIDSTILLVNGKSLKERTGYTIGPRDDRWDALPPGESLSLRRDVGEYFKTPGIYKVVWKGKSFQSPEILFRVVGKQKK
jgi:hypothetical protein